MKKTECALAMEMRKEDKELDAKFELLSAREKWAWLEYATVNSPIQSIAYAHHLTGPHLTVELK